MKAILVYSLVFFSLISNAQDSLYLMNGKSYSVKIESANYSKVYYRKIAEDGTLGRKRKKNIENVFAYKVKDSLIVQVYKQDTLLDNFLTISEMKSYMFGLREGRKNARPLVAGIVGVGAGAGSGLLGAFWGLIPAGLYPFGAGLFTNSGNIYAKDPALLHNEYYKSGYLASKKYKQARWGAIGSATGFIGSLVLLQYLGNQER